MLLFTMFCTFSTIHSATIWRLEWGATEMPWVRYRHSPKMERTTIRELTCDSVMGRSITGMGMVKYTCAPVMEIPSPAGFNRTFRVMLSTKGNTISATSSQSTTRSFASRFIGIQASLFFGLTNPRKKITRRGNSSASAAATGWKHGAVSATMATPTSRIIRPV